MTICRLAVVTIKVRSRLGKESMQDDRMVLSGIQDHHDNDRGVTNPIAGEGLYDAVPSEKRDY